MKPFTWASMQMICVYDNYYNKDTENGIANAQSALTNAIFCSGADCPFVDPQSPITLELPSLAEMALKIAARYILTSMQTI